MIFAYKGVLTVHIGKTYYHVRLRNAKKAEIGEHYLKLCCRYRGICVTSPVVKVFLRILRDRLKRKYVGIEKQSGFSAESSCVNLIFFVLKQILEKQRGKGRIKKHICVDLHKAYDTESKTLLFKVFKIANITK